MLDIEIIKWGCGFADGFEIKIEDGCVIFIVYQNNKVYRKYTTPTMAGFDSILDLTNDYSLFLQRVTEGINKSFLEEKNDRWYIEATIESIYVWAADDNSICAVYAYDERSDIDSIKEEAITYIYNQLK